MKISSRLFLAVAAMFTGLVSAATLTVINTNDGGGGSLRQAILDANVSSGGDIINFNIPGGGVQTIALYSALPEITDTVAINGYSQPGSVANTLADGDNALLLIRLDGINLTNGLFAALSFNAANGSSVRGLVIVRFSYGIELYDSSGCVIAGNWVGLDVDGIARGTTFDGISVSCPVFGVAMNNVIGGTSPADRNILSGNRYGVTFSPTTAANNFVLGNFIGTDATGTLPRGNIFAGVMIQSATNITIGGSAPGARNILSACTGAGGRGVGVVGGSGHLIQGNRIGTDVTGQYDLGNSSDGMFLQGATDVRVIANQIANNRANGINLSGGNSHIIEGNFIGTDIAMTRPLGNALAGITSTAGTNRIGGLLAGQPNTIQFNGGPGIAITAGQRNEISGNWIYDNGGLGIDLGPSGVSTNDPGDADIGANLLQNFPTLTGASSSFGATQVQGALSSAALTTYRLEFFASPPFDPTGNAEGQIFLGRTNVTTDANDEASFTATLPVATPTNYVVTATATDANGNTSEFSALGIVATNGSQNVSVSIIPASGNSAVITWPGAASFYQLEATGSISPTSQWYTITSGIVDLGQWKSFTVTNTGGSNQFFRLRKL